MDPAIGTWMRACRGEQIAVEPNKNILKLPRLVDTLRGLEVGSWPPAWKHHKAGDDAHVHFAIYKALVDLMLKASQSMSPG